jgi:hypothetical protein
MKKNLTRHISLQQFMQGNDGEAVAQLPPALLRLDGRSAMADLYEFPQLRRHQQQLRRPPELYVVPENQQFVFIFQARQHDVLPVDFAQDRAMPLVCAAPGKFLPL